MEFLKIKLSTGRHEIETRNEKQKTKIEMLNLSFSYQELY